MVQLLLTSLEGICAQDKSVPLLGGTGTTAETEYNKLKCRAGNG